MSMLLKVIALVGILFWLVGIPALAIKGIRGNDHWRRKRVPTRTIYGIIATIFGWMAIATIILVFRPKLAEDLIFGTWVTLMLVLGAIALKQNKSIVGYSTIGIVFLSGLYGWTLALQQGVFLSGTLYPVVGTLVVFTYLILTPEERRR